MIADCTLLPLGGVTATGPLQLVPDPPVEHCAKEKIGKIRIADKEKSSFFTFETYLAEKLFFHPRAPRLQPHWNSHFRPYCSLQ
jgi:hypothetical protein